MHCFVEGSAAVLEKNTNTPRNSYSKRLYNALWVMRRCDELLKKRGL